MMEAFAAFLFGLLIGSFLNVCVHRMPRDLSIVRPGSHCPSCLHPIAWFENIPLASYCAQGARCRHCRCAISWRYPAVELITGLLFLAGYLTWGPDLSSVKFMLLASLMTGMIFTDLETRLLPDEFTLGGTLLGLACSLVVPMPQGILSLLSALDGRWASLAESAVAAAFASGSIWSVGILYSRIRHKEGLGFGDVKMVAAMGAFLGLSGVLAAVMIGCILGTLLGLGYIYLAKRDASNYELPFGSFLGAAAILVALMEPGPLAWWRSLP